MSARRDQGAAGGDEGALLAGRFELGAPLGAGGMGEVFRATDHRTGQTVAVKVLRPQESEAPSAARFAAEIDVLAELAHPGIVAYVAHGTTGDGRPFLAMECLEGEVLTKRLERGALPAAEALALVARVADALHAAHRRGLVHRDVKPANLFLRGGEAAGVTLLDFGLVRAAGGERALTRSGVIVGTPDYMAPEQAQGLRDIGPAADVFALGCVLYHCLTGRSPFAASHVVAILGKVLFGEPAPLEGACPDLPAPVRDLVARMLCKDPLGRPKDGGAVAEALARIAPLPPTPGATARPAAGLGARELELVSVVVIARPGGGGDDVTLVVDAGSAADAGAASVLRAVAGPGVRTERLADGSVVATLGHGGSAVDQCLHAVGLARRALDAWPAAVAAVATARGVAGERLPLGEALERAAALLASGDPSVRVRLDAVTAALLDGRVSTVPTVDGALTLDDAPAAADASRPLLGRATPCVGREQELSLLEMTLAASFDEGAARAVLVVGGAGLGKSRLRHELLRRVERRGSSPPALRLEAKGELMRAASPLGLVAQALRGHFEVAAGDDPAAGRAKLARAVAAMLPGPTAPGVAELLGELCDLPFPDEHSVRLRAARQDPRVMQARTSDAFLEYLRAATEKHGVWLVLEDLHWGDRASMGLVELALREFAERPFFVAAFARPEIHELAPDLWKGHVTVLPLRPLGRRACERLATAVAGDRLDAAAVARIAEQSDGNALYLEELVRSACHGGGEEAPAAVVAMLQARIGWLDTGVRRVLRAASVFGESFALDGVRAVLGAGDDDGGRQVSELVRQEIVEARRDAPGSYRIRHALMRDAAYGLLTDDDRRLGHRLAASWLAAREADPAPIAEHHLLGGSPDEAGPWFVRAAQRAFDRGEFRACEALAGRARAAGVRGEARGALGALEAFCAVVRWDWTTAGVAVTEAAPLLPPGSAYWCHAQRTVAQLAAYRNDGAGLRACVEGFLAADPDDGAALVYGDSAAHMASAVIQVGAPALGLALLSRAEATLGGLLPRYPMLLAWLLVVRCTHERHTRDALAPQLARLREAIERYAEGGGAPLMTVFVRDNLGEVECRAGDVAAGVGRLRGSLADALALGVGMAVSHARLALANGLLARGDADAVGEAARLAGEILATPGISDGYQAMARDALAEALLARGRFEEAEREAGAAVALSPHTPVRRWLMQSRWSRALVGVGRVEEGWARAAEAVAEMDAAGTGGGYAELALLRAAAAAARAAGRADDAAGFARRADEWVARQAAGFDDAGARAAYLERAR